MRGGADLTASEQERSDSTESSRGAESPSESGAAPSEEELRARLEEELKRIKVEDVLLQSVVTLVNLGGQRLGLSESGKELRDLDQTRLAIEAVRALLPVLEQEEGGAEHVRPIRDALAQLQMAYAREIRAEQPAEEEASKKGEGNEAEAQAQPAQKAADQQRKGGPSGRLWVPPGSVH